MLRNLGKLRPHLLLWAALLAWAIAAPGLHDRFLIKQGWPENITGTRLPKPQRAGYSSIDKMLENADGTYELDGWAFAAVQKKIPLENYERKLVLTSASRTYILPAKSYSRPDVQDYFSKQAIGIDVTSAGFRAAINPGSLRIGSYRIGLLFQDLASDRSYFVDSHRCLTPTPNRIILEAPSSRICFNKN